MTSNRIDEASKFQEHKIYSDTKSENVVKAKEENNNTSDYEKPVKCHIFPLLVKISVLSFFAS